MDGLTLTLAILEFAGPLYCCVGFWIYSLPDHDAATKALKTAGFGVAVPAMIIAAVGVGWGFLLNLVYFFFFFIYVAYLEGRNEHSPARANFEQTRRLVSLRKDMLPGSPQGYSLPQDFAEDVVRDALRTLGKSPTDLVREAMVAAVTSICNEHFANPLPPPPTVTDAYFRQLEDYYGRIIFSSQASAYSRAIQVHAHLLKEGPSVLRKRMDDFVSAYARYLPPQAFEEPGPGDGLFSGALIDMRPDTAALFRDWQAAFPNPGIDDVPLFKKAAKALRPIDYELEPLVVNTQSGRLVLGLGDTPYAAPFLRLLDLRLPLDPPLETRFRHQWVLGDTGAGKTTFLSAMIANDLAKVARNEASLFIMDSQNELIPDIARLEAFAPGGALFGKLIYLEPDADYPLALNIFDAFRGTGALSKNDSMMLERGVLWMVEFFLKSLFKAEASPHQELFLKNLIPALLAIPDATIDTLGELLEPPPYTPPKAPPAPAPGYEKYKHCFGGLRAATQKWLAERMHSQELAVTRNALRSKVELFATDSLLHDMFAQPRNKLNLSKELQESKVILVNAKMALLQKDGTEMLGRFFIAKLVQAMQQRILLDRGTRLPVFAYIDEASDYISEEENVEDLIDKARKQRMGFVFANQRESQITSPKVRDALSRAAIQCRGQARGPGQTPLWTMSVNKAPPVSMDVPNTFKEMQFISDIEFEAMKMEMRREYSANPPAGTGSSSSGRRSSHSSGPDDIIDAEFTEVREVICLPAPAPPAGDTDEHTKPGEW